MQIKKFEPVLAERQFEFLRKIQYILPVIIFFLSSLDAATSVDKLEIEIDTVVMPRNIE